MLNFICGLKIKGIFKVNERLRVVGLIFVVVGRKVMTESGYFLCF